VNVEGSGPGAELAQGREVAWDGHVENVTELARRLGALRDRPGGPPLPVAGVLNLVAVPLVGEVVEVEGLIESLADHQPSRAVVVALDPDGEGIDAHLEARAQLLSGSANVVVELARITLHGDRTRAAASAVLPLLRSDLPTFLWWPRTPDPDDPLLDALAETADRVVTEAGRGHEAHRALDCLLRTVASEGAAITDLAWGAITPWRQLVTQLVGPEHVATMRAGGVAEIWHAGPEHTMEALLLAGWLRDCLGARLLIELHARPDVADGGLVEVHLESLRGMRLAIERIPGRSSAAIIVSGPGEPSRRRVLPLPEPTRAGLLAGELELQRRDRPFERALPLAATVAGR